MNSVSTRSSNLSTWCPCCTWWYFNSNSHFLSRAALVFFPLLFDRDTLATTCRMIPLSRSSGLNNKSVQLYGTFFQRLDKKHAGHKRLICPGLTLFLLYPSPFFLLLLHHLLLLLVESELDGHAHVMSKWTGEPFFGVGINCRPFSEFQHSRLPRFAQKRSAKLIQLNSLTF